MRGVTRAGASSRGAKVRFALMGRSERTLMVETSPLILIFLYSLAQMVQLSWVALGILILKTGG